MRFACLVTAALVTVSTTNGAGVIQARQTPAAAPAAQAKPNPDAEPDPMLLWPDGAPGALGNDPADRPTLTLFRARQPSGAAIIVAPGGGYGALASNHEGRQVANLLNAAGITTFVLKYRLGPSTTTRSSSATRSAPSGSCAPAPRSSEWRPTGLASWASRRVDTWPRPQARISMPASPRRPMPSIASAAGLTSSSSAIPSCRSTPKSRTRARCAICSATTPDPKLMEDLSNDLRVTADTPPTFLFHTNADTGVVAENSVRFYLALRRAKVPAELHIFENGPHGVGLALGDPALSSVAHAPDQLAPGAGDDQVMLNVEC